MNDPLAIANDVTIGKDQPSTDLVNVDMRFDPVAHLAPPAKSAVMLAVVSMGCGCVLVVVR